LRLALLEPKLVVLRSVAEELGGVGEDVLAVPLGALLFIRLPRRLLPLLLLLLGRRRLVIRGVGVGLDDLIRKGVLDRLEGLDRDVVGQRLDHRVLGRRLLFRDGRRLGRLGPVARLAVLVGRRLLRLARRGFRRRGRRGLRGGGGFG